LHAPEETIDSYQDQIEEHEKEDPRSSATQKELDELRVCLDECTKPAAFPSKYTVSHMSALLRFYRSRISSTPWCLNFIRMPLWSGVHRRGLVGGYLAFMLISKISATQLCSKFLKSLTLAERDQVREDFKKAFL
jgi:hypothetical protein